MYKQHGKETTTLFRLSDKEILCRELTLLADTAIKDATLHLRQCEGGISYSKRQLLFTANIVNMYLERYAASPAVNCEGIASKIFELTQNGNPAERFYQDVFTAIERYVNFDDNFELDAEPSNGV